MKIKNGVLTFVVLLPAFFAFSVHRATAGNSTLPQAEAEHCSLKAPAASASLEKLENEVTKIADKFFPTNFCRKLTPEEIAQYNDPKFRSQQAHRTFEDRFNQVAVDIHNQSEQNLSNLRQVLEKKRPGYSHYIQKAEKLAKDVDNKLSIEHETTPESLIAILKGGAFLSADELIRRGLISPDEGKSVKPDTDGEIGESDAVFSAIRPPFTSEWAPQFGEITVTFDKKNLLNAGYFSPFAFDVGSGVKVGMNLGKTRGLSYKCAVPVYKKWIFQGQKAYREFLTLSIAQLLWEKDLNLPIARPPEPSALLHQLGQRPMTGEELNHDLYYGDMAADEVETLTLQHHTAKWIDPHAKLTKFQEKSRDPEDVSSILAAYRGFASNQEDFSPFFTHHSNFWELKVPRQVPVDWITSIAIPIVPEGSEPWMIRSRKANAELEHAIQDYADRTHRKVIKSTAKHRVHNEVVVYTFVNEGPI